MSASARPAEAPRDFMIAVALGPVGRFIGGGRRSRDLWFGSRFLSEVTRRAALYLHGLGTGIPAVRLIMPTPERIQHNYVNDSHQRPTISNKILAVVSGATVRDVRDLLNNARGAAQSFLVEQIDEFLDKEVKGGRRYRHIVRKELVEQQKRAIEGGDFVEFYAAFTPIEGGEAGEAAAIERAFDLLAARKNTRAFAAPASHDEVPKSSLDPGRDSVLEEIDPHAQPNRALQFLGLRRALGIEGQERLDAISLIRRYAVFTGTQAVLPPLPFPPISRVVAEPWLEGASRLRRELLVEVREALRSLEREGARDALCLFSSPCREPGRAPQVIAPPLFDYDPSLFMEHGVESLMRALDQGARIGQVFPSPSVRDAQDLPNADPAVSGALAAARETLKKIARPVSKLHTELGVPHPYYALIEADGDGIGALLDRVDGGVRREIVNALYAFADEAWKTIEGEEHQGCAFYVGADELAAYLPLDRALEAAGALMALFHQKLSAAVPAPAPAPSLSVGMVVAHLKDDLRATRRRARDALQKAKHRRRACGSYAGWLCVREEPRGGSARISCGAVPIQAGVPAAEGIIADVSSMRAALQEERLSMGTAHALLGLCEQFELEEHANVGLGLARNVLTDKVRRSGLDELPPVLAARAAQWRSWRDVRSLANEILLAERINRVAAQRRPGQETP